MKKFIVTFQVEARAFAEVEAETLEEAITKVENRKYPEPGDEEWVDKPRPLNIEVQGENGNQESQGYDFEDGTYF